MQKFKTSQQTLNVISNGKSFQLTSKTHTETQTKLLQQY